MSYQLSYFAVLKACLLPPSPLFLLLVVGVPLGVIVAIAFQLKRSTASGREWWIMLPLVIIPIAACLVVSRSQLGSGYRLEDSQLKVKAPPASATFEPRRMQVALVASDSSWRPVLRTNGYGSPGLSTGWFKLQNGKKAVVFRHLRPSKMVVLEFQGRYYVLSHPGVEKLYKELLKHGAKENGL